MIDLDSKKHVALEFIKLGLDTYAALIQADCTDLEIEQLENDPDFNREVEFRQQLEERELLEKLNRAMDIGVERGNAAAVQWKLERLNSRWRSTSNVNVDGKLKPPEIYLPDDGRN